MGTDAKARFRLPRFWTGRDLLAKGEHSPHSCHEPVDAKAANSVPGLEEFKLHTTGSTHRSFFQAATPREFNASSECLLLTETHVLC